MVNFLRLRRLRANLDDVEATLVLLALDIHLTGREEASTSGREVLLLGIEHTDNRPVHILDLDSEHDLSPL